MRSLQQLQNDVEVSAHATQEQRKLKLIVGELIEHARDQERRIVGLERDVYPEIDE